MATRPKIKKEHIKIVEPILLSIVNDKRDILDAHVKYLKELVFKGEQIKDINKRLCYDILNCMVPTDIRREFYDIVYLYANDRHVYTMLKRIIKPERLTERGLNYKDNESKYDNIIY